MLVGNLKRNGLCPRIAQAAAYETVLQRHKRDGRGIHGPARVA
jgi:hypothetical protein